MSSFDNLRNKMTARARALSDRLFGELFAEYPLGALRSQRQLTQNEVADALGKTQAAVSKMEARRDFLISTVERYVRATGGSMRVCVTYPDAAFEIVRADDASKGFILKKDFPPTPLPNGNRQQVYMVVPQLAPSLEAALRAFDVSGAMIQTTTPRSGGRDVNRFCRVDSGT